MPESGFSGLAGFSGFRFRQLAVFAITEIPPKQIRMNARQPKTRRQNPENPIIPQILILTRARWHSAFAGAPAAFAAIWIPAFAGMTGEKAGMTGLDKREWRGWTSGNDGVGQAGMRMRNRGLRRGSRPFQSNVGAP